MRLITLLVMVMMLISGGAISAAENDSSARGRYQIRPSDVVLPENVPLGQYRRYFQPFENWILICDENLRERRKVCNASQTIEDKSTKALVFSWSLAATDSGEPHMIVRTAPDTQISKGLELRLSTGQVFAQIKFNGCNKTVCIGQTVVGPVLSGQISKAESVFVQFWNKAGKPIRLRVPLKGLKEAVNAI
ncbi:invasion associated locus B family protein [Microvirga sp. W0021]|uniref:Invasion associated locus B family protein n=1 Tax=Hohaiivirga grylli TaxID=3133970 RepID=A0ABV0BFI4_9HYPH